MTTLTMDAGAAGDLRLEIEAGEAAVAGREGGSAIQVSYGYFAGNRELAEDRSMDPVLEAAGSAAVTLRQTAEQANRARRAQAHIRLQVAMPAGMSLAQSKAQSATLSVRAIHGVEVALASGTLEAGDNSGAYAVAAGSGTVRVARPAPGAHHRIAVQSGTVFLAAGVLLPLVSAMVEQGVIQGNTEGRLERTGMAGWKLTPAHPDARSSVECAVGAGSILISQ